MEINIKHITFQDEEDRTNEIDILTKNLMHFFPNEEIMGNILLPLLIELVLSTTESKIWITVIINLKDTSPKDSNDYNFCRSIIKKLRPKLVNGFAKS